jgi:hypothetical protein
MVNDPTIIDFLVAHSKLGIIVLASCLFVSLCLIARLWFTRRRDSALRKILWSIMLLVPLLGWLFYAAFYHAPEPGPGGHVEYGQAAQGEGPGTFH